MILAEQTKRRRGCLRLGVATKQKKRLFQNGEKSPFGVPSSGEEGCGVVANENDKNL